MVKKHNLADQALFKGLDEDQSIQLQLEQWVKGKSIHNPVRGECCPDFSCCHPEALADAATREAFIRADRGRKNGVPWNVPGENDRAALW